MGCVAGAITLQEALRCHADLLSPINKQSVQAFAAHAHGEEAARFKCMLAPEGQGEYKEWQRQSRSLLEVMQEFPQTRPPLGMTPLHCVHLTAPCLVRYAWSAVSSMTHHVVIAAYSACMRFLRPLCCRLHASLAMLPMCMSQTPYLEHMTGRCITTCLPSMYGGRPNVWWQTVWYGRICAYQRF